MENPEKAAEAAVSAEVQEKAVETAASAEVQEKAAEAKAAEAAVSADVPEKDEKKKEKPKKTWKDIVGIVVNVILVIAIILAAFCTYVSFVSRSGNGIPNLFGMEFFSVQTNSMYPEFKEGDMVISTVIDDTKALRPGDIITYWTIIDGERVLNTHRITQVFDGGDHLIFETKGDNNSTADVLNVHESEVVGKYKTHINGLGSVMDYLQTSTGFLLVIVLPVALFFLYHLVQFFRVLFEYQNVKNRLKFQEELEAKEEAEKKAEAPAPAVDKAALEAELREKIKAEMMAELLAQQAAKDKE